MSRGLKVVADCLVEECRGLQRDAIALPGGRPGAERLRDSAALKELLLAQSAAGKLTAAVCASRVTAIQTPWHSLMSGGLGKYAA